MDEAYLTYGQTITHLGVLVEKGLADVQTGSTVYVITKGGRTWLNSQLGGSGQEHGT